MEYFILILAIITCLWLYHRAKYSKSNYQKFEYYLTCETNEVILNLLILFEVLLIGALGFAVVYYGGSLIHHIITL